MKKRGVAEVLVATLIRVKIARLTWDYLQCLTMEP